MSRVLPTAAWTAAFCTVVLAGCSATPAPAARPSSTALSSPSARAITPRSSLTLSHPSNAHSEASSTSSTEHPTAASDSETGAPRTAGSFTDVAFATPSQGAATEQRCKVPPGYTGPLLPWAGFVPWTGANCTGVLLTTTDGGTRWDQVLTPSSALEGGSFLPSGFGWSWGPSALYLHAAGGNAWKMATLPAAATTDNPVQWVSFSDPLRGWLAIGGLPCATQGCPFSLYRTTDGGATWTDVGTDIAPGSQQPTFPWLEYSGGGAIGSHGAWILSQWDLETTTDGGRQWKGALPPHFGASGVTIPGTISPDGDGWLASGDRLWVTTTAGTAWKVVRQLPTPLTVAEVAAALNERGAWALLQTGCASDAGCTPGGVMVIGLQSVGQVETGVPKGYAPKALAPLDARSAWAVAAGPHQATALLSTDDGGASWSVRYTLPEGGTP